MELVATEEGTDTIIMYSVLITALEYKIFYGLDCSFLGFSYHYKVFSFYYR